MRYQLPLVVICVVFLTPAVTANNETVSVSQSVISIDDQTDVANHTWDSDGVTIVFDSDIPRRATITDASAIMDTDDAAEIPFRRVNLDAGLTEVSMAVDQSSTYRGERIVTVAVGETMVALSDGRTPLFDDVDAPMMWMAGIAGAAAVIILQLFLIKRRERKLQNNLYEAM
ncbi:hypothetical protein HTZ84_21170 [Haloterrigena sp. SYSU A558-1]|uniref:Uncharacterized protein n=1 Tax=Haloterrigena gelatinilytica TaxID=2741724 RepID=A0ABX2LM96_9EURY|nr:hypothetical protein [Haloterrigena gelatinilytica]NUC74777.1 hypothetical protein [Haloterrigena gelatinilytica]